MLERVLGIIPARGGSKGVPRKNLRVVAGESLIVRAVRTAQESERLTHLVTSTDDDEIASAARAAGSRVRRRPDDLATDASLVVLTALDALVAAEAELGVTFDAVALVQPTAPLRRGGDLDAMVALLDADDDADCAISVCEVNAVHPAQMYRPGPGASIEPFWPELEAVRRQDLPPLYHRNGAFYVTRRSTLVDEQRIMGAKPLAYVMPSEWLANIDDERDLLIADALAERWDAMVRDQ